MRRLIKSCLYAALLGLATGCSAQDASNESLAFDPKPDRYAEIDALIEAKMAEFGTPGLSLAIIKNGAVDQVRAYGVASLETGDQVTRETLFETASLSKPVFAYFVLRQAEQGVLDLDRPLSEHLPHPDTNDKRADAITARMALTHRTGFPNWRWMNEDERLDIKFEPGAQFSYSGEGFEYLAMVVSHELGTDTKGLAEIMRADLESAAGADIGPWVWDEDMSRSTATGYSAGEATAPWRVETPIVSASLFSSAERYARFLIAAVDGDGLGPDLAGQFISKQTRLSPDDEFRTDFGLDAWGLGVALKDTAFGEAITHGGVNEGFTSWFTLLKEARSGYVFLTNSENAPDLNRALETALLTAALD